MADNIYLSGTWTSIPAFLDGTFDGNGNNIYNLNIEVVTDSSRYCFGLFEKVGRGTVENFTLSNVSITYPSEKTASTSLFVGAVAGINEGTISDCTVSGSLDTTNLYNAKIGGIVGRNTDSASVTHCINIGSIVYVGPWTLLSPRPCMGQIMGWFASGTHDQNTCSGTCDYHLLSKNQKQFCSEGVAGKSGY